MPYCRKCEKEVAEKFCPDCKSLTSPRVPAEKEKTVQEKMKKNPGVVLEYTENTSKNNIYKCVWEIRMVHGIDWNIVNELNNKTDKNINLNVTARKYLMRKSKNEIPPIYSLIISGIGEDNRCTWCHYYRKALIENVRKQNVPLYQIGSCIFENVEFKVHSLS